MEFNELVSRAHEVSRRFDESNMDRYGQVWGLQELMLGFVGDVGDLSKLVQARTGLRDADDVDARLAHELADCLWSVIVLAERCNVDLEKAFVGTMSDLEGLIASGRYRDRPAAV